MLSPQICFHTYTGTRLAFYDQLQQLPFDFVSTFNIC
jgi:hypothetical protein